MPARAKTSLVSAVLVAAVLALPGAVRSEIRFVERGPETGGEEERSTFGTVAKIIEAEEFPDGRWALATVGVERFRVTEWLDDDPYPRAEVELWPDPDPDEVDVERFEAVASKFRRCLALASEMGVDTGLLRGESDLGGERLGMAAVTDRAHGGTDAVAVADRAPHLRGGRLEANFLKEPIK